MAGNNPTLYAFVKNVNTEVDVFGLDEKHISRQIKDVDAMNDINMHLGDGHTTNIHPGKGTIDNNRIFAQQPDGSWHAVRIGNHEMKNDIGKGFHYHLEKFDANGNFIGPDEQVYVTKSKARGCKSS